MRKSQSTQRPIVQCTENHRTASKAAMRRYRRPKASPKTQLNALKKGKHVPACLHRPHRCVGTEALLNGGHGRDDAEYGST